MGRTEKDDRKRRPEWKRGRQARPEGNRNIRGGRKSLEQLVEEDDKR